VQVVAAPPLPPTVTPTNTEPPEASGTPDLVASGMQYWPSPAQNAQPIDIQVKVTNSGTGPAAEFSVTWLSNQDLPGCSWSVSGLGAGESKNLDCQFTYNGNATASYWTTLIVDSSGQIAESNEGNNSRDAKLKVAP
jgi:subtilase family serine protease